MSRTSTHDILAPPQAGYFMVRLVKKGWRVAARIIVEDGHYQAEIDGELYGKPVTDPLQCRWVMKVWETGEKLPDDDISRYRHALAMKEWALKNDTDHPAANPRRPIDLTEMQPLYRSD